MGLSIERAAREQLLARVGFFGDSGSGKTDSALSLATALCKASNIKPSEGIVLIDSDNRSSLILAKSPTRKADRGYRFNFLDLTPPYTPEHYQQGINIAVPKCHVLIVDSVTPEWEQILLDVDKEKNTFTDGWKNQTPRHNKFVKALTAVPVHLIVTIQGKMEMVINKIDGKNVPTKVGMGFVQRKGFGKNFQILGEVSEDHGISFLEKNRCPDIEGLKFNKKELPLAWGKIIAWLNNQPYSEPGNAPQT